MGIMTNMEETVATSNRSINPFHAVIFPRFSLRRVFMTFRKYRCFGIHSKLDRSMCSDFEVIAAGDVPPSGHIESGKRRMNEA